MWYPVKPAEKEGPYNPLPTMYTDKEPEPAWFSLRKTQQVDTPMVRHLVFDLCQMLNNIMLR